MRKYPTYPKLTPEQISKLPWNRVKNIMAQVRAVINAIEMHHGYENDGDDFLVDRELKPEFPDEAYRNIVVANMVKPMKEYFQLLKDRAAQLPHEKK